MSRKSYVILAACTNVYFMVLTPLRISAVLFVACIERFDVSREAASVPIILLSSMRCMMGPLAAYLRSKIGTKATICLGCTTSALGTAACFFAESISFVTLSLGFVCGVGECVAVSLIHHVLSTYFRTNYALVCGVCFNGSVISAFVFSVIAKFLIADYGVSGMFLIIGSLMLNGAATALLIEEKTLNNKQWSSKSTLPTDKTQVCVIGVSYLKYDDSSSEKQCADASSFNSSKIASTETNKNLEYNSVAKLHNKKRCIKPVNQNLYLQHQKKPGDDIEDNSSTDNHHKNVDNIHKDSDSSKSKSWRILLNPHFIIILIVSGASMYLFVTITTIMLDISREKEIPSDKEIYILMSGPVTELFSNLIVGQICDKGCLSRTHFSIFVFLAYAVVCVLLVWVTSVWAFFITVMCFGVFMTGAFVVIPGLVYEYIAEDQQALTQASKYQLYSVLCFTVSPLIGYFRDYLGTYKGLLYIQSVVCLACAFLITLMSFLPKPTKI